MPKLLKINPPAEARFLGFDLRDLVALIPQEGAQLAWCVSPMGEGLDAFGEELDTFAGLSSRGTDAVSFMKQVNTSDTGVPISWADLVRLSDVVEQISWGAFIGCQHAGNFAELPAEFHGWWRYLDRLDARFYERVEIAFQSVDSSYWLVYTRDDAVGERIVSAFESVEILDLIF